MVITLFCCFLLKFPAFHLRSLALSIVGVFAYYIEIRKWSNYQSIDLVVSFSVRVSNRGRNLCLSNCILYVYDSIYERIWFYLIWNKNKKSTCEWQRKKEHGTISFVKCCCSLWLLCFRKFMSCLNSHFASFCRWNLNRVISSSRSHIWKISYLIGCYISRSSIV